MIVRVDAGAEAMLHEERRLAPYRQFLQKAHPERLFLPHDAIEFLCGHEAYEWGERFPGVWLPLDDDAWSEKAVNLHKNLLESIRRGELQAHGCLKATVQAESFLPYEYEVPDEKQYIQLGDLLKWAIDKLVYLNENLLLAIGAALPVSRFHETESTIQATARIYWHKRNYQATIPEVQRELSPLIGPLTEKRFREIVSKVDPRPVPAKRKPSKNREVINNPFSVKPLPRLFRDDLIDLRELRAVARATGMTCRHFHLQAEPGALLFEMNPQLKNCHPILVEIAKKWTTDSN